MKKFLIAAAVAAATLASAGTASATTFWVEKGVTLNARTGPGTYYDVIGQLKQCRKVHVVAYKKGWAKVSWKGHYFWVAAKYLSNHKCHYGHATYKKHGSKKHHIVKKYYYVQPGYGYGHGY